MFFAVTFRAFSMTDPATGNRMPARIAMMVMTTSSSISVKAETARCLKPVKRAE